LEPDAGDADEGNKCRFRFSLLLPAFCSAALYKMKIYINDSEHRIEAQAPVHSVLDLLGISPSGIALAVNSKVIPRSSWSTCLLNEGDKVLLIKAAQGG
jgi:sulfur carrier protein